MCKAPRNITADPQARYRVDGQWIHPSKPFTLPAQSEPMRGHLSVKPHPAYKRREELLLTIFGGIILGAGLIAIIYAGTAEPEVCKGGGSFSLFGGDSSVCTGTISPLKRQVYLGLGGLSAGAGAVLLTIGSYGLATHKTTVRTSLSRRPISPTPTRDDDY